jgi:heptosyltransferase-1
MGDVLHAMPAVAALRALHSDWEIAWAIEPRWSPLLSAAGAVRNERGEKMPLVDRCIGVQSREWKHRPLSLATLADIRRLRRHLRAGHFDVCVDMQGLIRSAVVGWMAGTERFVGREETRETPAKWFYDERVRFNTTHVVEQGCELLGAAVGEVLHPAEVALPVDAAAEAWCDRLLSAGSGPFAVMAPTAGWGAKEWPTERFGAVAAELGRAGYRVFVNAVSVSEPTAQRVLRASEGYAVAIPCTLSEMIALIRRAGVMIAGDTGPLHLAAALQRPVVAIYGPTDPLRTGPYGACGRVLRNVLSATNHARHRAPEPGMLQIHVHEVAEAALKILRTQSSHESTRPTQILTSDHREHPAQQ